MSNHKILPEELAKYLKFRLPPAGVKFLERKDDPGKIENIRMFR
jgi:uncharacterized protein (DUF169 family)